MIGITPIFTATVREPPAAAEPLPVALVDGEGPPAELPEPHPVTIAPPAPTGRGRAP